MGAPTDHDHIDPETEGPEITTEWYDGPLRSMRLIVCKSGTKLVQVDTVLGTVGEPFTIGYDDNVRPVMVRFTRDELQMMMDILDGKIVKDFFDKDVNPAPVQAPTNDAEASRRG